VPTPKLQIKFFALNINAEGVLAIGAAIVIFLAVLASYRL
jgi:hypothetical protein